MPSTHLFLRKVVFSITGPDLISVPTGFRTPAEPYLPNGFEKVLNLGIGIFSTTVGFIKWSALLWLPFLLPNLRNILFYTKALCTFTATYLSLLILRGFVRLANPLYKRFVITYLETEDTPSQTLIDALTMYGFRYPWPSQFNVRTLDHRLLLNSKETSPLRRDTQPILSPFLWLLAHTIGVRMVYPGCLGFINSWTMEPRMKALDSLRASHNIRRVGLTTRHGLFVESFYADRREEGAPNGHILVICCEGNAGFAEIGICAAPLAAGHSVLAWNHPGFGASMGMPFPEQERNAMEAVLLFAMHQLDFDPASIRLFGWSIGGYPATWAGTQLPNIGGMILDATFDTLDDLGRRALPFVSESIPVGVIRKHFDLNNLASITKYPGPIRIMRRSDDDIISTKYPHLFNAETEAFLWKYLVMSADQQEAFLAKHSIVDEVLAPILQREFRKELLSAACREEEEVHGRRIETDVDTSDEEGLCMTSHNPSTVSLTFPSSLGQAGGGISEAMKRSALIYLASKYFVEVPGNHCAVLNPHDFLEPWSESLILQRSRLVSDETTVVDEDADNVGSGNGWEKVIPS